MKIKYKNIYFEHIVGTGKAAVWTGCDRITESIMGIVNWYIRLKRFMYFTFALIIDDSKYTEDICHFVEQLNGERE